MPPDYSGQNLRGRSFKGQNLEGANFSYADIRGVDFRNTKLKNANFNNAIAGLTLGGLIVLLMTSLLFSGLSGLSLSYFADEFLKIHENPYILSWLGLTFLFVLWLINLGLFNALVVSTISATFSSINSLAIAITSVLVLTLAVTIAKSIGKKAVNATLALFIIASSYWNIICVQRWQAELFLMVLIANSLSIALSLYMSQKALLGDKKYVFIKLFVILLGASDGTRFQSSNLTNADFTGATLKNTNLLRANITRTCWLNVKNFELTYFGNTYLDLPQVRQLVITGEGQNLNLDHLNLNYINLEGSNLQDASFIGAELNNANLQDADLSRAILKQTQLDNTDFTGATLTGAYIEDWNITNETNFRGVKCEYVYMHLPTKENPNPLRKPDNNAEVFADGEFGDFIQPIFDTLDLYHNQGVDPRAIAISFKELAENNPDAELEFVAMEKRGEDKFLLRAKTTPEVNKSELSAEYFETYNHLKSLSPSEKTQYLLTELKVKDTHIIYQQNQIISYENMINTALGRPSVYSNIQIEKVRTMTHNPGGFSVGGNIGGNVNNVQGDNNRNLQGDNNQVIQGDNNQVGVDTEAPLTQDDIVKLLEELEALILKAELPEETKEEVSEEISAAKKATNKQEPKKNIALANLESVAQTLEKTNKTVDAGQKLWSKVKPIIVKIASWLGAAAGSYLFKL